MTITAAVADLQTKLLSLSGMKSAPQTVPEGNISYPFGVSYERLGTFLTHAYGFGDELATIWSEIHVSRTLLGAAITQAAAFRDPFLKLIMADPTLGGAVSTVNDIRWTFGVLSWGGVETLGYRFEIDVKVGVTV